MKFIIRDDDPCAFTDPSELINCYKYIWNDIPVNLSVTPFRIPGNDPNVPQQYKGQTRIIPLSENKELVQFLRLMIAERKVNIALHGYHHCKFNGLPEYVSGTDLLQKTKEGKRYLENILDCEIDTFVPPNNAIGREGIEAVIKNGLNLVTIPSFICGHKRSLIPSNLIRLAYTQYYKRIRRMQFPHVLTFNDHKEVAFYSVTPAQDMNTLEHGFNQCKKANGIFGLAVHYHAFDRKLKSGERIGDVLDHFIDMTKQLEKIEYCIYADLWNV